jgi:2-polyprenyl-3-methyl-5-hydroxy-6-metoxy-1,4-benzoquinol methylase
VDDLSKEYIISYYNKRLQIFGDKPESLGWSPDGQILRFRSLLDIDNNIAGSKVLDFGCGKGDFYGYLREKGIDVRYTGFDINEKFISIAASGYPECSFRTFDINIDDLNEEFDYIFLCGVFNLKVQQLNDTIKTTLIKLFKNCRIAMAFNALSAYDTKKAFELNYLYPEEMFSFALKELSPYASIRHDRVLYDFTMFMYKEINMLK